MNKKRVALALAAALGINSLMVTVGTVGRQAVIAHAQDSRLSADLAAKLDTLQIKYLDTSVEVTTNGNAEVTFKNLDFNNVDKIDAGTFAYKIFDERANIETNGNGATGAWNATTKKLTVSGMTEPGIYTGDVTVTYKGGNTEKYTLSLVKKPSDTISFDTEVGVGTVKLSNIKFNNGNSNVANFKPKKVSFTLNNGTPVDVLEDTTTPGTYVLNLLDLGNKGKLKDSDTLKVNISYGTGNEYTLTSEIVLVNKNQKITNAVASNDTNTFSNIKDTLKTDFGVTTEPEIGTYVSGNNEYKIVVEGEDLLTYSQTVSGANNVVGGAELTLSTNDTQVDVYPKSATLPGANPLGNNYVPAVTLSYGISTTATTANTGLIGDYTLTIGNDTIICLDAMSGLKAQISTTTIGNDTYSYVNFSGTGISGNSTLVVDMGNIDTTQSISLKLDRFDHGYNVIPVTFGVKADEDKGAISTINQSMGTNSVVTAGIDTANTSEEAVKTSIIVSVDLFDGVALQSKFVKTSSSEGQVTIVGGAKLLNDLVSSVDYTKALLTVDGIKATVNSTSSNNDDLVFDVQFNGQVPSKSDAVWTLDINGKKIEGTVDLTGGAVESVNLTSVKATNQGMENITDQFKVDASFGTTVPTGGKVTVDTITSDRVTFDQFKEGSHAINNVVGTGKYQGTYSAGVIVSNQPITIDIAEYAKTSSSVTLEIDADFFGNATTGVKAAYISYREAGTNNPYKELDLAIPQDIKDGVITKVVSGLKANTKYEFVAVYTYNETNDPLNNDTIESNVLTVVTNPTSSNSGTISGGSSGSSSSTSSTTVNVTGTNSTTGSNSISVTLPSGTYHHESNSNPSIAGFKYKDKDGKTVTETNDQYSNVKVRFENGRVVVDGLVPGKDYVEISINYNDRNNRTRTLFLKNVKINATNEGQSYLANVYNVVFNRPADENGYMFHFDNLSNKRVSLRAFLLNMINEREFEKIYTTAETKVEALYNAIVNRDSDTQGKAFWVEEYKKLLAVYGSATATLQAIADRMVNETELKNLAQKINFEW